MENLDEVVFIKNKNPNKPEKVISNLLQSETIQDVSYSVTTTNDIKTMFKLATKIQSEVFSQEWKFNGDFSSYQTSSILIAGCPLF